MKKIVLIGAGRVGFHLGRQMHSSGLPLKQVFSREAEKAKKLAEITGSAWCNRLEQIATDADLYIVAVQDDAIVEVAGTLSGLVSGKALAVHTSGATPASVLAPYFRRYGIFYPLQTFSEGRPVDFREIPVIIDSANPADLDVLRHLTEKMGSKTYHMDEEQRKILHVAAVFVNNFTNHLFQIGRDILVGQQIPFALLKPLIRETADKIEGQEPADMQTGPAVRGDIKTIEQHLEYLKALPDYYEVYRVLTRSINGGLL